ncbi:hypothetical protein V5F89_02880 [Pelagerythrobacter marensis]|uniref:Glycosyltransferase subfamily 4-like N-terminal domain-containing protein n=1 Tax=Pelagerythrobacter marensis TaxID=543877 RepID=A0ABZ2D4A1_9SPHN
MKKLNVLGNSSSPHLRTWLRVLPARFNVVVYDIHTNRPSIIDSSLTPIIVPLARVFRFTGKLVQYTALGLWLRWFCRRDGLLHAHNASGYGLSALLSGRDYIVTVYGSEIYNAHQRGLIYNWILKEIISSSKLVTTSSDHMRSTIVKKYGLRPERIFSKMLLDPIFLEANEEDRRGQVRTWFVNRRMAELYCTISVVEAFKTFIGSGGVGALVLLEGDADTHYAARVRAATVGCSSIEIITGFVDQDKLIEHLSRSHFCISVPESDQFSSSILEGAACGVIPILRNLESYKAVSDISIVLRADDGLKGALVSMFRETASLSDSSIKLMSRKARNFAMKNFSYREFINSFADAINEVKQS